MTERIFKYQKDQDFYKYVLEHATQDVKDLASLLMLVAFDDEGAKERELGLAPLYLLQAWRIKHKFKADLLKAMLGLSNV